MLRSDCQPFNVWDAAAFFFFARRFGIFRRTNLIVLGEFLPEQSTLYRRLRRG